MLLRPGVLAAVIVDVRPEEIHGRKTILETSNFPSKPWKTYI